MNYLLYQLGKTQIREWPYKHFYLDGCFPWEFYLEIQANMPDSDEMHQIGEVRGSGELKRYKQRFCAPVSDGNYLLTLGAERRKFWREFTDQLCDGRFARLCIGQFGLDHSAKYRNDCYLVRDGTGYALGPHTDTPKKAVAVIFYLPEMDGVFDRNLGTSVYVPKERGFTDPTGKHLERERFDLVTTMPYEANTAFGFARSDSSFHGVEQVDGTRWCLLYDIQHV